MASYGKDGDPKEVLTGYVESPGQRLDADVHGTNVPSTSAARLALVTMFLAFAAPRIVRVNTVNTTLFFLAALVEDV